MINTLSQDVYGLFELDSAGTVMYSKIESNDYSAPGRKKFLGLNFFEEVAPFKNVEEFRRRFRYFVQSSGSSEKFNFVCQFDEQPLEVKVMLTQIFESQFDAKSKLIIVDIRKV
jgi:photoactive yellow protein